MSRAEKRQALNLNEMLNFQGYEGRGGRSRGGEREGTSGASSHTAHDPVSSSSSAQMAGTEVEAFPPIHGGGRPPGADEDQFPGLPGLSKSAKKRAKKKEKERQSMVQRANASNNGASGPGGSSSSAARVIPTQSLRPPMTPVFDQSHVINRPVHEVAEALDLSDPNSWRNVAHGNTRGILLSTSPGGTSSFDTTNFPTLGSSAAGASAASAGERPSSSGWGSSTGPSTLVDNTIQAREAERNKRLAELKEQNKRVAALLKDALGGDQAALQAVRQVCGLYQSGQENAKSVVDVFNQYDILHLLPDVAELCPSQESGEALLSASIEAQSSKPNSFRSKILGQSSQSHASEGNWVMSSRTGGTGVPLNVRERNAEVMQRLKDGCKGNQVCARFQKGQATAEDVLSVFERFEIVDLLPAVADLCPNSEHRDALIAAHLSSSFQGLPSSSSSRASTSNRARGSAGPQVRGSWTNRGGMSLADRVSSTNSAWSKASKNDWNWRAR
eukprot:scaffold3362_cov402-Prasinococcus_capsulatus_cf.AAC.21